LQLSAPEATNLPASHPQKQAPAVLYGEKRRTTCMVSGFCHEVDELCTPLGNYAVYSGNSLLMFRDNLLVPSASVKSPMLLDCLALEHGIDILSQTSGTNHQPIP